MLGKKGRLTTVLRGIGALPADDRPRVGAVANVVRGAIEAALAERGTALRGSALAGRLAAETLDVTTPGRPIRSRHAPSEHRRHGPDRRDLRPVRVRRPREPRDRGRPDQLPDAQHPARSPGPRPVGHPVRRRRGPPAPDAHVAGPDPRHAGDAAADPGAPARALLPLRGDRRVARLRVLPGRGAHGRRGDDHGRPARPARRVRPGDVRRRQEDPLPAGLLPVHGAVRRLRRRVPRVRRRRAARPAAGPAG